MRKRTILAIVLALAMPQTAFAKANIPYFNIDDNSFIVSGQTNSGIDGKSVKIIITRPGYSISDLNTTAYKQAVFNFIDVETNSEGIYTHTVQMKQSDQSGEYTVYVQDDDTDNPEQFKVYYTTEETKKSVIKNIIDPVSVGKTRKEAVTDAILPLGLNKELVDNVGIDNVVKIIEKSENLAKLNSDEVIKTVKILQQLVVVEAYNQNLKSDCIGSDGSLLFDDIIGFTNADKDGSTFNEMFNELLSDDAKGKVIDVLFNNNFSDAEDLLLKYKEEIILKGINGSKYNGTGHISKLLTDMNAKALGNSDYFKAYNNISNAITKRNIEENLIKKSYDTIKGLNDEVIRLLELYSDTQSSGSTSSGSSSGGSWGGNYNGTTIPSTMVTNKPIDVNGEVNVFSDIDIVPWAKEAIEALFEKNIISGVGNYSFAPNNNVTREQFVVMIVNALGLELDEENVEFTDVVIDSYYSKHVAAARKAGIINGIGDGLFGVGKTLSRQDIATMIYRAYFSDKTTDTEMSFADKEMISDYAFDAVGYMTYLGIINGFEDATFKPHNSCTRAQAAKILYGAMMQAK